MGEGGQEGRGHGKADMVAAEAAAAGSGKGQEAVLRAVAGTCRSSSRGGVVVKRSSS